MVSAFKRKLVPMQRTIFGHSLVLGFLVVGLAALSTNPSANAQTLLAQADPRAEAGWATCIDAPTRRCVLDQAVRIAESTKNDPPTKTLRALRFNALLSIAEAQARIGLSKEAVAAFAQLQAEAESIATEWAAPLSWFPFIKIAAAMARAGMAQQARETAQSFKDEAVRGLSLEAIAKAQAKAGMIQEARETVRSLTDDLSILQVLLAITQSQARAGLIDEARKTAESIKLDSYRAEALAAIAEAEARAGRGKQAAATFNRAMTLAQARKYDSVFVSIAGAQARAGLNDDARKTLQFISNDIDRAEALAMIAEAEARAGLAKQAAEDFERAIKTARSLADPGQRSELIRMIAGAMAGAGLFQEAVQTVEQTKEIVDYERSDTLDSVAEAMAGAGRIGDAIKLAQSFDQVLERARTLARIAIVLPK